MNKLITNTFYRILTLLLCTINLSLCGMRSSSVADIYSVQPTHAKKYSCFSWLFRHKTITPVQDISVLPIHSSCETPICQQLKNALRAGDIETVAEHLAPDNVNLTIQARDYYGETHTANLLEFVLYWNTYTSVSFKLQFIELLTKTGFEYPLLETVLATDDIELVERFIATPAAYRPSECNLDTPLAIFMYQAGQSRYSCKRKTAQLAADKYASNDRLDPELRTRFAIIAKTLAYQSLKEVVTCENVKLLKDLELHYPEILQMPVVIKSRSMSIADYAEALFNRGLIRTQTFTVLEDFFGPTLPPLPTVTEKAAQQYHSDGDVHYHSKSIDLDLHVTPAPNVPISPTIGFQNPKLLHIDQKTPTQ